MGLKSSLSIDNYGSPLAPSLALYNKSRPDKQSTVNVYQPANNPNQQEVFIYEEDASSESYGSSGSCEAIRCNTGFEKRPSGKRRIFFTTSSTVALILFHSGTAIFSMEIKP